MKTQQSQVKITMPIPMKEYVQSKAQKFGLPLAGYIKHVLLKDIEDMDFPVYQASEKTEKAYQKATINKKKGLGIKVTNIDKFFNDL